ncbi:MAG: hypothetical protein RM347_010085 [Nostoc sp. ChiQUE02]|uniref:hypothetical protein n=1 Tax=Nostoc sp. ChiQUE02 TaxID=3075377 RepID=UPI002AD24721|nr:hypothetical protein [Nostoc sp. ChiQUE02]MDZ8229156.1 hypothetical protein [Nostoc sp. ChiQUE02]
MNNFWYSFKGLGIAISGAVVLSTNSAIAQIDQNINLPKNYGVTAQDNIEIIPGSTQYKTNLSKSLNVWCIPCPSTGSPLGCNC